MNRRTFNSTMIAAGLAALTPRVWAAPARWTVVQDLRHLNIINVEQLE
jgi:hypothetical protein